MPTYRISPLLTAAAFSAGALLAANALAQTAAAAPAAAPATTEAAAPDQPISSGPISPPETELLHNATVSVLQADYNTALMRIPENIRGGFGVDTTRINTLLQNILIDKTLAAQARKDGIDKEPQVQARIQMEVDKILTGIVIEREMAQWRKVFNALPNTDLTAREEWVTHPEKYSTPPRYQLTVLVFNAPPRTPDDARHMADVARAKILGGADMNAMARELSDDPEAKTTGGRVDWSPSAGKEQQPLAAAVARLGKDGDLSQPIKTAAGYQLVRVDSRKPGKQLPFEEVKASILDQLRTAFVDARMADAMNAIRKDPTIVVNQPAVDALVVHVDPEYMRKLTQESAQRGPGGLGEKRGGRKIPIQMGNGTPAAATPDLTAPPAAEPSITGK